MLEAFLFVMIALFAGGLVWQRNTIDILKHKLKECGERALENDALHQELLDMKEQELKNANTLLAASMPKPLHGARGRIVSRSTL